MGNRQIIDEASLLAYFSGTLPDMQRAIVKAWIEQSEDHRKIANDVYFISYATDAIRTMQKIDTHTALQSTYRKIRKNRRRIIIHHLQRFAAILFLPMLCITLYFAMPKKSVEYVDIRTNPGMVANINLPDGSCVWLNSKSHLRYPSRFNKNNRIVELDGEAFFSVYTDKSKPFIVQAPFGTKVEVSGTEFNMEAYHESGKIETTLISGSVKFHYTADDNKQTVVLKPTEAICYDTKTKQIAKEKPYIPTRTAWKDGIVIFRNTPFREVLNILEKRFNAEFIVTNAKFYDYSYTGRFETQQLSLILEHFRLSSGIRYQIVEPMQDSENLQKKTIIKFY